MWQSMTGEATREQTITATDWQRQAATLTLPAAPARTRLIEISLALAPRSRWRRGLPSVTLSGAGQATLTYSLEARRRDQRIAWRLPPCATAITLSLTLSGARLTQAPQARCHAQPAIEGPILILAPHPDDAEIAAGGFYTDHAESVHLVTLSCGEQLKGLKRQYLSGLDDDLDSAIRRKAEWRRWNVFATPLLSGIPPERSTLVGVPDGAGWALMHDGIGQRLPIPLSDVRRFNRIALPPSRGERLERDDVVAALRQLIDTLKPATLLVTDPEFDPHPDHRAASLALALALDGSRHRPRTVLLYANHYRDAFPPGPAFQPAWMPPAEIAIERLFASAPTPLAWPLSPAMQKHKALLLDAMSDLSPRADWSQRHRRARRAGFVPTFAPERDRYFQAAIRSTELFRALPSEAFVAAWRERNDSR
ncbi:PIG-L deacetylase family protein [Salinicola endophyticus]|uniref:PIG-L deacetylase family protein n=1 Tax=Salinicola endophyticus TaxID=1949083 RepID=UPI0013005439|nr:PIG-L family deacetylase [Salinicola endophyticus]